MNRRLIKISSITMSQVNEIIKSLERFDVAPSEIKTTLQKDVILSFDIMSNSSIIYGVAEIKCLQYVSTVTLLLAWGETKSWDIEENEVDAAVERIAAHIKAIMESV